MYNEQNDDSKIDTDYTYDDEAANQDNNYSELDYVDQVPLKKNEEVHQQNSLYHHYYQNNKNNVNQRNLVSNESNIKKTSHKLLNEDLSSQQQQHQPQQYKHDRLKKICTMALDLQTKLQQTKLKLFGLNPNDESMIYYDKNLNSENEPLKGNKFNHIILWLK